MLIRLKCHHCGHENPSRAKKCRGCGKSLEIVHASGLTESQVDLIEKSLSEKFELLEEIGYGGMSVVYKAVQKNLDRIVALKVILPQLLEDAETIERFHLEARIAGSLNHPNIITIYDEGQLLGVHYMAMEFIEGEDLFKIIRKEGPLQFKLFPGLFTPLASALQYLESRELVHRDIKSSNIIITNTGRPVLMDFGIASIKHKGTLTQNGSLMGTPEYMSPEQANNGNIDERSDLYSLGIVMYECLTGMVPFKGETYSDTIRKITNEIPKRPSKLNKKIPRKTDQMVLKLLEKDPQKRYQGAHELLPALNQKTTVAKSLKDNILIGGIALLFIVIVGSGIALFIPDKKNEPATNPVEQPLGISNKVTDTVVSEVEQPPSDTINIDPSDKTNEEVVQSPPVTNPSTGLSKPVTKPKKISSGKNSFDRAMEEGNYYLKNGELEKANNAFNRARSADPESLSAKQMQELTEEKLKRK